MLANFICINKSAACHDCIHVVEVSQTPDGASKEKSAAHESEELIVGGSRKSRRYFSTKPIDFLEGSNKSIHEIIQKIKEYQPPVYIGKGN